MELIVRHIESFTFALAVLQVVSVDSLMSDHPQRGIPEQYVLVFGDEDPSANSSFFGDVKGSDEGRRTPPPAVVDVDPLSLAWDQPINPDQDQVVLMVSKIYSQGGPSDETQLPKAIELSFSYSSHFIAMNLTLNDNIGPGIRVYANGTMLKEQSENQDYAFYFDTVYKSSVLVEKVSDETRKAFVLLYSGTFFFNGSEYGFEPMVQPSGARRRKRRSVHDPSAAKRVRRQTRDNEQYQIVYQKKRMPSDPVETRYEPYLSYRLDNSSLPSLQPDSVGSKAVYSVEILGVIDYRIYSRYYNRSLFSSRNQRMTDAVNNIIFYFGHVFNGVDMRYRSIVDSQFSISTVLVGIHIALTPADAPYVEKNRQDGYPLGTLNADPVLNDFSSWLRQNQGNLPAHDQASLFTSENLLGLSGNRISGLAIIKGICTDYSVSLTKDLGLYSAIETDAHEIGHNLGAGHDGIDNTCNAADLYIMSAFPGLLSDDVYKNAFHFSPCSITEFRTFLGQLAVSPRPGDHCLLDHHNVAFNLTSITGQQQPGQRYNPNVQCVIIYGLGSYYCGGNSEDANICRTMECYHPQYRYCYSVYEQRAFDGTTCGNKLWCQMGDCVYDAKAPVANSTCTYGDYKGPYTNGLSCKNISDFAHWNCYNPYYFDDCCESCPAIRDSSRVGCEYGDHSASCLTMSLSDCYNSSIRDSCCDRCKNPRNVTGCEYGDKADWCSTIIKTAFNCYAYGSTCCDSCAKYSTGVKDCDYGDRASWCQSLSRSYCYSTERDCCITCPRMKNLSAVGCEYGDQADWCHDIKAFQCYSDSPICCESCRKFYTNVPGCLYGDNLQACYNLQPHLCYSWNSYCCITCPKYYTGISGCEYGDQVSNCSSIDCLDSYRRSLCCSTCSVSSLKPFTSSALTSPVIIPTSTTTTAATTRTPTTKTTTTRIRTRGTTSVTLPSTSTNSPTTLTSTTSSTTMTTTKLLPPTSLSSSTVKMTTTLTEVFAFTSRAASSAVSSGLRTKGPYDELEVTAICQVGSDKAQYCSTMPARDCYVLADTCCSTCRESYMMLNGCEYGNRAGWCESYLHDQAGCLTDANAFWCCSTCATTYGVQCNDTVSWCNQIRPWDCYENQYQADYCCATCRRYRKGNRAGCDYGDRVTWCQNYSLDYICPSNPSTCCKTCQNWQRNKS